MQRPMTIADLLTREPKAPWVESAHLAERLDAIGADEETRRFAEDLARDGVAVIDFEDAPSLRLFDEAIAQTDGYFQGGAQRVQDAWRQGTAVRALALHPKVTRLLSAAYGRTPFPFQTLNFQRGSEQGLHSDALHFHSEPERFMCGVWFALEDVRPESGPLIYRKGSHRLPVLTLRDAGVTSPRRGSNAYAAKYVPALTAQADAAGAPVETAMLKKGQALVWSANLAHGGAPILDPDATRRSLVVHFFFENCLYHTPLAGAEDGSRLRLRLPIDVRTGGWVWPRREGRRVGIRPQLLAMSLLHRLLNKPLTF
jgi:hypothetical protein